VVVLLLWRARLDFEEPLELLVALAFDEGLKDEEVPVPRVIVDAEPLTRRSGELVAEEWEEGPPAVAAPSLSSLALTAPRREMRPARSLSVARNSSSISYSLRGSRVEGADSAPGFSFPSSILNSFGDIDEEGDRDRERDREDEAEVTFGVEEENPWRAKGTPIRRALPDDPYEPRYFRREKDWASPSEALSACSSSSITYGGTTSALEHWKVW
jgi:hypothetical protein